MKQLDPMLMQCEFGRDMISSVTLDGPNAFTLQGYFRTNGDMASLIYSSADLWSHPDVRYELNGDFRGVRLSYDYEQEGDMMQYIWELNGPQLTVYTTAGIHWIRLERYCSYIGPVQNNRWSGHFTINFDDLQGGWWSPQYSRLYKIDPVSILKIQWTFPVRGYVKGGYYPIGSSSYFKVKFTNWTVTGARDIGYETLRPNHPYRLADGYDDEYNVVPERYVKHFYMLGFRDIINLYVGASHYYDKEPEPGFPLDPYEPNHYSFIQKTDEPLNRASEAWLNSFFRASKQYGYDVVASVSMESVELPHEWRQRQYNGFPALSGWTPATKFCSFCNSEALDFYKRFVMKLADMQHAAGLPVIIQLGEPWWWMQSYRGTLGAPCFYDESTKAKFLQENGYELPIYTSMWEQDFDHNAMEWLRDQIGIFTHALRDHVKSKYPDAQFTVLFFPPTVIDPNRVGPMMQIASFPRDWWAYPNLDFFQIEDYDWVTEGDPMHEMVYDFPSEELGYPKELTHYFAGFVLNPQPWTGSLTWKRIEQAADDGLDYGMGEVFIWAGAQIKRDGWQPHRITLDELRPFSLSSVLRRDTMKLAMCWDLITRSGKHLFGTDSDVPIEFNGKIYPPSSAFTRTAIKLSMGGDIENAQIEGFLSDDAITDEDIMKGIYDYATLDVYLVDRESQDSVHLLRMNLGKITFDAGSFKAETEGLSTYLSRKSYIKYAPTCQAYFCDDKCKLNKNNYKTQCEIIQIIDSKNIVCSISLGENYSKGTVEFITGSNAGAVWDIDTSSGNSIRFYSPLPATAHVGDEIYVYQGCDKTFNTCKDRFNNATNFRGQPFLPGADRILWRGGQ